MNNHTPLTPKSQIKSIDDLLVLFQNVKKGKADNWTARCPAHDDKKSSLSIAFKDNKALIYCFAGCELHSILKSLNLDVRDLFLDHSNISNVYQYRNEDKSLNHEKLRYQPKRFTQRRLSDDGSIVEDLNGIQRVPYNLPNVINAIKQGSLILYTEGEKDADTGKVLGYTATTFGSASDWKPEYAKFFKGAHIILFPDKDDAGLKLTSKMIDSLKPVVKSIKTLVLPLGKDLTEWVEAGNQNLQALIDNSPDQQIGKGIPKPVFEKVINGYKFKWQSLNLVIVVDSIRESDAEIAVYHNGEPIYISGFKMMSISHKAELTRELNKRNKNIEWDIIINQITVQVMTDVRKGEEVVWLNDEIGHSPPKFLLEPLFIENAPNIIYADQSSAKSLTVTLIDILMFFPKHANNGLGMRMDSEVMALFIDWENDASVTGWNRTRLMRGLKEDIKTPFPYLHVSNPLSKNIDHIVRKVNEVGAKVVILDSLGMAAGGDLNATEPALAFFSALRQIPATPIILAHTAKDINNKRKTIYGNAYYQNESRMVWEAVKEQEVGADNLTVTLFNRKPAPFLPLHDPMAFKFSFTDEAITVKRTDASSDARNVADNASDTDKVLATFGTEDRALTIENLKTLLPEIPAGNIRQAVYRLHTHKTPKLEKIGDSYQLIQQEDDEDC